MVWMLVFWGAVVWLIVWGVRNLSGQPREQKRSSALDIAGERYARGEITKEQFEEIKRTLSA
jgi:putative membrane protein